MASSPGGGSTVCLVSKHNTQLPSRRGFTRLLFVAHSSSADQQNTAEDQTATAADDSLTTEGQMWEWMYGGGGQVPCATIPGTTAMAGLDPSLSSFNDIRVKQRCAFCDKELQNDGTEARCPDNHTFGMLSPRGLFPGSCYFYLVFNLTSGALSRVLLLRPRNSSSRGVTSVCSMPATMSQGCRAEEACSRVHGARPGYPVLGGTVRRLRGQVCCLSCGCEQIDVRLRKEKDIVDLLYESFKLTQWLATNMIAQLHRTYFLTSPLP